MGRRPTNRPKMAFFRVLTDSEKLVSSQPGPPPTPICIYRNLEYPIHTAGVNFRGPKENPAEAGPKGRIVQKNQFAAISDAPSSIATRAKSACICSTIADLSCWFSIVI